MKLGELLCSIRGHEQIRKIEGTRICMECIHCGYKTTGVDISKDAPVAFSSRDIHEIYEFLLEQEYSLHPGG